jgi:hypothetical protein
MADRSFLGWPFFEDRHRALAERVEATPPSLSATSAGGRRVSVSGDVT